MSNQRRPGSPRRVLHLPTTPPFQCGAPSWQFWVDPSAHAKTRSDERDILVRARNLVMPFPDELIDAAEREIAPIPTALSLLGHATFTARFPRLAFAMPVHTKPMAEQLEERGMKPTVGMTAAEARADGFEVPADVPDGAMLVVYDGGKGTVPLDVSSVGRATGFAWSFSIAEAYDMGALALSRGAPQTLRNRFVAVFANCFFESELWLPYSVGRSTSRMRVLVEACAYAEARLALVGYVPDGGGWRQSAPPGWEPGRWEAYRLEVMEFYRIAPTPGWYSVPSLSGAWCALVTVLSTAAWAVTMHALTDAGPEAPPQEP